MINQKVKLQVNQDGDTAYLFLPDHPGKGEYCIVSKQISLSSLIDSYKGPEVYLDFDKNGLILGIEILLD